MFERCDLITMKLLSDDDVFQHINARDRNGKMLSVNQCLRAYGARCHTEIPEFCVELQREKIDISSDMVLAIAQAMEYQWAASSFPFDPEAKTEAYDPSRVPLVVRNAIVRVFIPYETPTDLKRILRIYTGEELKERLRATGKLERTSEHVYLSLLRAERAQPVVVRLCINPLCGRRAITTVEHVATSTVKYDLDSTTPTWSGKLYTPHQRCVNCRALGKTAPAPTESAAANRNRGQRRFRGGSLRDKLQAALAPKAPPPEPTPEPETPMSVPAPELQTITVPAETPEA